MSRQRSSRSRPALVAVGAALALVVPVLVAAPAGAAQGFDRKRLPDFDVERLPAAVGSVKNLDEGRNGTLVAAQNGTEDVTLLELVPVGGRKVASRAFATLPPGTAQAAQDARGSTWVVYGAAPEEPAPPGAEGASAWLVDKRGKARKVLDIAAFQQQRSPDPYDLEALPGESNPYDVEALEDGSALVADAAGNDLLRVWPSGRAITVACFPDEVVTTADVPAVVLADIPGGLPPALPAESVPTGVAIGPDGYAYVSELKGFPFPKGASKVWRVNPDAKGAGCTGSPDAPVPPGRVVAGGFSGINDVAVDRKGALYVTELHVDGTWAVELGFADPASLVGKGRVTKVTEKGRRTVVGDAPLTVPGSVAVTRRGRVYAVDSYLLGGTLLRLS